MPQVEVDEVLSFWELVSITAPIFRIFGRACTEPGRSGRRTMGNEATEVPANYAVPGRTLALIELPRT